MEDVQDLNLTFSGCGFLGIYHLGVVTCLKENAPLLLKRVRCFGGASAGSFAAVALVLDLSFNDIAESVIRLAKRANSLTLGPLHPSFHIVRTIRRAFEKSLPENAHEIASGRLHISLTRVSDLSNVIVSEFNTKEELIEALIASSYVPFYSGLLPAKFQGKYYVDGGISDNLPQHFTEGETITVSPFSGESDICPTDASSNDAHIHWKNTSVQFTLQNLYRCSRAFFPPETDVLFKICREGYRDTLRFLRDHYPETLTKESLKRASISKYLPAFYEKPSVSSSDYSRQRSSSSVVSTCSTSTNSDVEVFSSSENEEVDGEENEENLEGESKLHMWLQRTGEAVTEAELWSCYIIRRFLWVLKLAAKPCIISVKQISLMAKVILESLPKVERTGNEFIDHLLAMIYMVIHTYQDKHQVQIWTKSRLAITNFEKKVESVFSSVEEWTKNNATSSDSPGKEIIYSTGDTEGGCVGLTCKCDDEDSAIEVIHDCDVTSTSLLQKDKGLDITQISCTAFSKDACEKDNKEDVTGLPGINMSCSIYSEGTLTITYSSLGRNAVNCSAITDGTFQDIYKSSYEENATGSLVTNMSCNDFANGTFEDKSYEEETCVTRSLGTRWEDEGGARPELQLGDNSEEYIVLDGYDSDVESDISAYEELQGSS